MRARVWTLLGYSAVVLWLGFPLLYVSGALAFTEGWAWWHWVLALGALYGCMVGGPSAIRKSWQADWAYRRLEKQAVQKRLHAQPLTLVEEQALSAYIRRQEGGPGGVTQKYR